MNQPNNTGSFLRLNSGGSPELPTLGRREDAAYFPPLILVPGEAIAIYVNSSLGGGSLSLVAANGTSYNTGASINSIALATGGPHMTIEFSVPNIPDGQYVMQVGGNSGNCCEVISDTALANKISGYFSIRHNNNLGPFFYGRCPDAFRQKLRLRVTVSDQQPQIDVTSYRSTSTGKVRNLRGTTIDWFLLSVTEASIEDHKAYKWLSLHDSIILNGIDCARRPENSYKVSYAGDVPYMNGEFGLYDNTSEFLLVT